MELTGRLTDCDIDYAHDCAYLTFCVNEKQAVLTGFDSINEKDLAISIKLHKKKRSLDANAYCWALIEKLAQKLNIPKIEVYRQHIKDVGVFRQVEIDEKAVDTLIHSWQFHGIGWIVEKVDYAKHDGFVVLHLYYGSSTYNTKQMSRLIDNIVQDCKEQGIETKTPAELDRLKSLWEAENV